MRIKVNNPNDIIRNYVRKLYYDCGGFFLEYTKDEEYENQFDLDWSFIFDDVSKNNYELYRKIIGVIWTDFWLLNSYGLLEELDTGEYLNYEYSYYDMIKFKSVDDVIKYIDKYPELLPEMIISSLEFSNDTEVMKRIDVTRDKQTDIYLNKINPLFIFDKIEYTQEYDKDDIYTMYLEHINDLKQVDYDDDYIIKYYSKIYIKTFIQSLCALDKYNYDSLVLQLLKDFYILEKYKEINNLSNKNNNAIIELIENKNLNDLIDKYCSGPILMEIINSFLEFTEEENKNMITNEVFDNIDPKVKKKLFAKK